jgi:hypothetical protein
MATVDDIIDRSIVLGDSKASQSEAYGGLAVNAATGNPGVKSPKIATTPSISAPGVSIPSRASGVDTAVFESTYDRIIEDLSDRFADFFVRFFPINPALITAVETWLQNAINGGTGINPTVESKIWQRDRDRITSEFSAASEESTAAWAAKGFPLPPGVAVANIADMARKRSEAIAASSRDAAIKAWEIEVENVRFAVAQAIDYRTKAIAAAGDYIRALSVAPNLASSLSTESSGAQARLISAAASFYNARISAAELAQRRNIAEADFELKAAVASGDNATKYVTAKVDAAVGVAQSLGQQASAALNAVNATVQKIVSED